MTLYVKSETDFDFSRVPEFILAVDPGQNTLGVYCLNTKTKEDRMLSFSSNESIIGVSMGATVSSVYDKTNKAFSLIEDFIGDSKDVVLICEQATTAFAFSSGIIASVQSWVTRFKMKFGGPVVFISNRLTAFFLKKKKINGADSKRVILSQFPNWKKKIDKVGKNAKVYSHPCDAVLMAWAVYYEYFNFPTLRKLKREIKYV